MPPIYDDYNDEYDIFSPPTIEEEIHYDYNMPPIFMVMRIIMIAILLNLLPLQLIRMTMFMWRVIIILCMCLMIRMFYVIVILLILFMMLLNVIMREGNMVLLITTILSFPSLC